MSCEKAHRLRNDLQAILGWLCICEDAILNGTSTDQSLSMIKLASERMLKNVQTCGSISNDRSGI